MKKTVLFSALAVAGLAASGAAADTLEEVKARGAVNCGISTGLVGFASQDANGDWQGFDVAVCRAVAAAVFGDPAAVNFNPVTNIQEITQPSVWWDNGAWQEELAFSTQATFALPELGERRLTRIYHEELETLVPRLPGIRRAQFH